MVTVIAYVDGFNLYHGLHQAYGPRYLWLDLQHLIERVRPHDQIAAVRYFTAEVKDDPDGLARQRTYLAALKAHSPAVEVVLGRYQTKKMSCRQCGSTWISYEEKETDVNIQQYLSEAKNPYGYCGVGGTGVSCPVGVAKVD